jgi:arylsulfatase A-like enzyme
MPQRPNVLILMVDQQRYDACGCYGSRVCQTPSLDRLAEEGVRFTHAYTSVTLCSPTRATFWSGLRPNRNGILINTHWDSGFTEDMERLHDDVPILSELFESAGYRTAHFGKWHVGPDSEMARRGFEHVVTRGDFRRQRQASGEEHTVRDVIARDYIIQDYVFAGVTSAEGEDFEEIWLCRRAEEWLRAQAASDQPFFCCVSTAGPHPGYVVPASYAALYDPAQIELWPNYEDDLDGKPAVHRLFRDEIAQSGTLTPDEWRTCIARYYAFVTLIDEAFGRLLDTLDALGVAENTLVLFVSDHGDLIGAHKLWDKGPMVYEEQIHIPLVVRWHGVVAPGASCDAMVTLIDLMPTLAEAAGLSLPGPVDGRSLMPFLRGETVEDWPDDVYIQYNGEGICLYSIRAVRSRRNKYVYYPYHRDELYDLSADPWEMHNLIDDPAAASDLADMRARMARWMRDVGDPMVEWNVDVTPKRSRF